MRISKIFYFDAAHHLPGYKGLCQNNHGHSFSVEVVLSGNKDLKTGMIIDFHKIKELGDQIISLYDHQDLNDLFVIPTAENIATWIYVQFARHTEDIVVEEVSVWEQPTSKVTYTKEDWLQDKGEPEIDP